MPETCTVLWQKKFGQLECLIGYLKRKVNTKFLGLQTDNHLNWKDNTEQMIPKLSAAYYVVRSAVHISKLNTLRSIYYAYYHSIIKYEIIVWGKSTNSGKIFTLQKKIFTIVAGAQPRTSSRSLFKQLPFHACKYFH